MKLPVGLLVDDRYLDHAIKGPTPENPERLRGLGKILHNRYNGAVQMVPARRALRSEVETVHSAFYLEQLEEHCQNTNPHSYDRDTYLMNCSLSVAELAAGGCFEMADRIMAGEVERGFALIRPPGHHAEPGRGMGFCIFNNVALTVQYLRRVYKLNRILVVDFDAHHGNGTQECFYDTDEVLFVSVHQRDLFPFSGHMQELGCDAGLGYTVNLPVFSQFGDEEYTYLLGRLLQCVVEQYLPQVILVSAGYDGHRDDTISGTLLTTEWFGTITSMLVQFARESCGGRLLMVLEGGYNPQSLAASVIATIDTLLKPRKDKIGILYSRRADLILGNHPLQQHWIL